MKGEQFLHEAETFSHASKNIFNLQTDINELAMPLKQLENSFFGTFSIFHFSSAVITMKRVND